MLVNKKAGKMLCVPYIALLVAIFFSWGIAFKRGTTVDYFQSIFIPPIANLFSLLSIRKGVQTTKAQWSLFVVVQSVLYLLFVFWLFQSYFGLLAAEVVSCLDKAQVLIGFASLAYAGYLGREMP